MKLSPGKVNDPGAHQVTRRDDGTHVLHLADEAPAGTALLREVMRDGARTDAGARPRGRPRARRRRARAGDARRDWPRWSARRACSPCARAWRRRPTREFPTKETSPSCARRPPSSPSTSSTTSCPAARSGWPGADAVVAPLLRAARDVALVVKTRDAHPAGHCSFVAQGGTWPPHCVVGTHGAELHPAIAALPGPVIDKATALEPDSYSGFDGTGLADLLRDAGITHLLVGGLATDYCVKVTVLHALAAGFDVTVLCDAIAAVDVEAGDGERALREMAGAGARVGQRWVDRPPGSPWSPGATGAAGAAPEAHGATLARRHGRRRAMGQGGLEPPSNRL